MIKMTKEQILLLHTQLIEITKHTGKGSKTLLWIG